MDFVADLKVLAAVQQQRTPFQGRVASVPATAAYEPRVVVRGTTKMEAYVVAIVVAVASRRIGGRSRGSYAASLHAVSSDFIPSKGKHSRRFNAVMVKVVLPSTRLEFSRSGLRLRNERMLAND
jgi:hypothetical protein